MNQEKANSNSKRRDILKIENKTLFFIDGDNLGSQCYYGAKSASKSNIWDITLFLFMKRVLQIRKMSGNSVLIFFFDSDYLYRTQAYPWYKQHKNEIDQENKSLKKKVIEYLNNDILPSLGFQCFNQHGYEGDDLIAAHVSENQSSNKIIIISTDEDLFQLIKWRVHCYNMIKDESFTRVSVEKKLGVTPIEIPIRKALIGKKNEVPGFEKIGKVTANKIIKKEIPFPEIDQKLFQDYLTVSVLPFQNKADPIVVHDIKKFYGYKRDFKNVFTEHRMHSFTNNLSMIDWTNTFRLQ